MGAVGTDHGPCGAQPVLNEHTGYTDYFLLKNSVHLLILKCSRKENFPSLHQP